MTAASRPSVALTPSYGMMHFPQCNMNEMAGKSRSGIGAVREAPAWTPSSWQACPHMQQPVYPDAVELDRALKQLGELPPLSPRGKSSRSSSYWPTRPKGAGFSCKVATVPRVSTTALHR